MPVIESRPTHRDTISIERKPPIVN